MEFSSGKILLLGALGLDAHVQLRDSALQGWYEAGVTEWFLGYGDEHEVFAAYAELLGERLGRGRADKPFRVWCSWYSFYTAIEENCLRQTFDTLDDQPFDVFQVDDGWQAAVGDWEPNAKFPSGMTSLATEIRTRGRKAGLWLAPLIAVESSRLFHEHPDWFVRGENGRHISAGVNWGEQLFALDTTHPAALDWLSALMERVRSWGFDYIKLDFLYAGALPGKRHLPMPREAAYRHGLGLAREALGNAYLLTCGAPILPTIGLCDALRIGPDVSEEWENFRAAIQLQNPAMPGVKNAIRTTLNRLWLSPLLHIDPDVVYFRSRACSMTSEQKNLLRDLALVCHFKATSDPAKWLTTDEKQALRAFLMCDPVIEPIARYAFRIDGREVNFAPAMTLPPEPAGPAALAAAFVQFMGNQAWIMRLLTEKWWARDYNEPGS